MKNESQRLAKTIVKHHRDLLQKSDILSHTPSNENSHNESEI